MKLIVNKDEWLQIKKDLTHKFIFRCNYIGNEDGTFVIKDKNGKLTHNIDGRKFDEKYTNTN